MTRTNRKRPKNDEIILDRCNDAKVRVYFSNEAEEAESKSSDVCGLSQVRGPLRAGGALLLLASIDVMDAMRHDGRKLGRSSGRFEPFCRRPANTDASYRDRGWTHGNCCSVKQGGIV